MLASAREKLEVYFGSQDGIDVYLLVGCFHQELSQTKFIHGFEEDCAMELDLNGYKADLLPDMFRLSFSSGRLLDIYKANEVSIVTDVKKNFRIEFCAYDEDGKPYSRLVDQLLDVFYTARSTDRRIYPFKDYDPDEDVLPSFPISKGAPVMDILLTIATVLGEGHLLHSSSRYILEKALVTATLVRHEHRRDLEEDFAYDTDPSPHSQKRKAFEKAWKYSFENRLILNTKLIDDNSAKVNDLLSEYEMRSRCERTVCGCIAGLNGCSTRRPQRNEWPLESSVFINLASYFTRSNIGALREMSEIRRVLLLENAWPSLWRASDPADWELANGHFKISRTAIRLQLSGIDARNASPELDTLMSEIDDMPVPFVMHLQKASLARSPTFERAVVEKKWEWDYFKMNDNSKTDKGNNDKGKNDNSETDKDKTDKGNNDEVNNGNGNNSDGKNVNGKNDKGKNDKGDDLDALMSLLSLDFAKYRIATTIASRMDNHDLNKDFKKLFCGACETCNEALGGELSFKQWSEKFTDGLGCFT